MRRAIALLLLLGMSVGACGSTMRLKGTIPGEDNRGSCALPWLVAAKAGAARTVHFLWTGPEAGEDSLRSIVGAAFDWSRDVAPGTYTVRARVTADSVPDFCDTTITVAVKAPPWRVTFTR